MSGTPVCGTSRLNTARLFVLPLLLLLSLTASACQVDLTNPPRLATAEARQPITPNAEPIYIAAPTPTAPPAEVAPEPARGDELRGTALTVWINETSAQHRQLAQELAADFAAKYGADVAIQLVSPALMPELVSTGVLSGTLPDVILHPVEYTMGWVEDGVLDPAAADAAVEALGRDTFDPAALDLVSADGLASAVPSDGYHQLLLYRADWFNQMGLEPPENYAAMSAAAERVYDRERIISGLIVPTESNLVTTHQAFEQLALGNGCQLIDGTGEVTIQSPACAQALDQYYTTINRFSPPGVQTDTSALRGYIDGRTGMIMASPAILTALAGLDPLAVPTCQECADGGSDYLAKNTGLVTAIQGPAGGEPAAFGNLNYLGITTQADTAAAQAFVRFWLEEGYERWLALDSERKVPLRLGTADEPRRYIDAWGTQPLAGSELSLTDIYGPEVVARLRDGIASAPRWGIREGQGALMSRLYEDYTIAIVLQEMLSGYFSPERTLEVAYQRVIEHIPGMVPPTPTPSPEPSPTP